MTGSEKFGQPTPAVRVGRETPREGGELVLDAVAGDALIGAVAAVLGATLQSATGFGFALLAAPLLVAVLGPRPAVSAIVILALIVTALTLAAERRRPRVDARETVVLVGWSVPGLLVGALLLGALPERGLKVLVAVVVLLGVGLRLLGASRQRGWSHPRAATAALTSGVLSTSTGIGGPPLVFHLLGRGLPRALMRDTLAVVWLAGGVLSAAALVATGTFSLPPEFPYLVVATLVGYVVGRRLFATLYGDRYERVVLGALTVTAVIALVASAT